MPVYPFRCTKCEAKYELLTSIEEYLNCKDQIRCPECGSPMVRVFTPFAIHGLGYDIGYRPGVDDPVKEVKHDLKKLEQSMTETHNLKAYREKKKALNYFAEANEDILK